MLRSLDAVGEGVASVAWGRRWAAPHPWSGAGIELTGRHPGRQRDLLGSGKRLAGKGLAAKQPPPALLQIQPAGALGDEHLADAGWSTSQVRVEELLWLERLSVITTMPPSGLAASTVVSSCWSPVELREGAVIVTSCPSATRSAPYTHVFSGPRL